MCSTKCPPGISLSNDLVLSEILPIQPRESSEFEFCVSGCFEYESSSADELFFNGVIIPTQNHQGFVHNKRTHQRESSPILPSALPPLPPAVANENSKKENTEELVHVVNSESEKKSRSKSFWGFRRSNSVTYDSRKNSFCSLPLLSRSNSTGSVQTPKRTPLKDVKTQNPMLQKQHSVSESNSKSSFLTSSFSNSASNPYSKLQKAQKKNQGGFYGSNLYVNPILNVPPPYITKETANIFGLSSFLRGRKEKKSR
ncbi:uncharacterized protein LOC105436374 [Cucumis sativus]|uniref:Uncharacterized protein n=1 Tax=Cucumis sativus TaxID=3659 RepID=A0A0A0LPT8_CUCSA|nr:uncharacterized protein LOC105436374 [Cucumis sativus]KGN63833.1 hypothetical protein Csa_014046 [Cucumis sativus]